MAPNTANSHLSKDGEKQTAVIQSTMQDPKKGGSPQGSEPVTPLSLSLRTILTVPPVLLIILAVAVVGYLSFLNGQAAVNDVALQLRNETALHIKHHLISFLNVPHQINQINAYAIRSGELDPDDPNAMQQYFLEQVRINPSVSSVYFGVIDGGLVGGGREGADGSLYVTYAEGQQNTDFRKFGMDELGNIVPTPIASFPNFDARKRPWYVSAAQIGHATWSDIYILFTGQDMAIAASRPVYNEHQQLLGVVSVDIFLSQLVSYLETVSISPAGQVFIMERSGALVATSGGESLFKDINNDGANERVTIKDSRSPLIRQAGDVLIENYKSLANIPNQEQQLEFTLDGKKQLLHLQSVRDNYGIDWIVVVVIPESVFMERIDSGNHVTFALIAVALILTSASSIFITSRITRRVAHLDQSAQSMAAGNWDYELDTGTHFTELNRLALSFNHMKGQLRQTLSNLTNEVAERKRAEQALAEENLRRRLLFEESADGILIIDPATARILEFNTAAHEHLGYTREEFAQLSIPDVEALETREETRKRIEGVIANRRADFDTLQRTKQGEIRNVLVSAQIINGQDGPIYYCIWRDITDKKRAENALRESEARFRAIAETAGDFIYVISRDGIVLYANELAMQILDIPAQELIGRQLSELFPPENFESQWKTLEQVFETGQPLYMEALTRFPCGETWQATWLTPMRDEIGRVVSVLGDSRNITERKQIEQELQSQRDFATQIINTMGQGLTVTDKEGRFEFVNPAYARLFGYEPNDLIGKYPRELTLPEDHASLYEQRLLRLAGQTTTYESRLMRADGSIANVVITGAPRGQPGEYEGAIAVITDLTEQKRIESELLHAKEALEVSNHRLEEALIRERHLARIDELTGINNRRHLFEVGTHKFAIATRYKQPLSVIMFDIDHFKRVNDIHGHALGDETLVRVAQIAHSEMRGADVIGRYGGEEFIILAPMTSAQQAFLLAERIRNSVADLRLPSHKGEISITLSIGIAELEIKSTSESIEEMFRRSDVALYEAKQAGRNRTVIYKGG